MSKQKLINQLSTSSSYNLVIMTEWIFDDYITRKIISKCSSLHDIFNIFQVSKQFQQCTKYVVDNYKLLSLQPRDRILFEIHDLNVRNDETEIEKYRQTLWLNVMHHIRYFKTNWSTVYDGLLPIIYNKVLTRSTTTIAFSKIIMDLHEELVRSSKISGYGLVMTLFFGHPHEIDGEKYRLDKCAIISTSKHKYEHLAYYFETIHQNETEKFGKLYLGKKYDGVPRIFYAVFYKSRYPN